MVTGKVRLLLPRQGGDVYTLAFSPDGRTLASASAEDNAVRLWEVANGKSRGKLEGSSERDLSAGLLARRQASGLGQ